MQLLHSLRAIERLRIVILATACALAGCSSLRNGGAPDPAYSVDQDLASLREQFKLGASVSNFYAGRQDQAARNEFISSRVALANLSYMQFISALTNDKQQLDAATDMFTLGLNIAGTLVGGAQAKENLAAAAALVLGSKATIDKHYYFEKTTPALISAMNAQRKVVLVRILEGATLQIEQYSFPQALADTHEYYAAGTLTGGISAIQVTSGEKEAQADAQVRLLQLDPVSTEERTARREVSVAILEIINSGSLDRMKKALNALGLAGLPQSTAAEASKSLEGWRAAVREGTALKLRAAILAI
jgi:hypothetical protein